MINLQFSGLAGITTAQVPPLCPGKKPSPYTVARWMLRGVRGVVLKSFFSGGRRCTTPEFVEQFFQELNAQQPAAKTDVDATVAENGRQAKKALDGILGGQSA